MKRISILCLAIFLLALLASSAGAHDEEQEVLLKRQLFQKNGLVVVAILVREGLVEMRSGSAIPIDIRRLEKTTRILFITNPHVISKFEQIVRDPSTEVKVHINGRVLDARVVGEIGWQQASLLLEVEIGKNDTDVSFLEPIKIAAKNERRFEKVLIAGFINQIPSAIEGEINRYTMKAQPIELGGSPMFIPYFMEIYAPRVVPGMSGSGVYNLEGELVGIIFGTNESFGTALAAPISEIKFFLEENLSNIKR